MMSTKKPNWLKYLSISFGIYKLNVKFDPNKNIFPKSLLFVENGNIILEIYNEKIIWFFNSEKRWNYISIILN